jgi:hypothetical protein
MAAGNDHSVLYVIHVVEKRTSMPSPFPPHHGGGGKEENTLGSSSLSSSSPEISLTSPGPSLPIPSVSRDVVRSMDDFAVLIDHLSRGANGVERECDGVQLRSFVSRARQSALYDAHALITTRHVDMLNKVLRAVASVGDENTRQLLCWFLQANHLSRPDGAAQVLKVRRPTQIDTLPPRPPWSGVQQLLALGLYLGIWLVLECAVDLSITSPVSRSSLMSVVAATPHSGIILSPRILALLIVVSFVLGRDSVWAQAKGERRVACSRFNDPTPTTRTDTAGSDGDKRSTTAKANASVHSEIKRIGNEDEAWHDFLLTTTIAPLHAKSPTLCAEWVCSRGGNKWSEPPGEVFWLRGGKYLENQRKYESLSPVFPLLGVDLWRNPMTLDGGSGGPMPHICRHPQSFFQKLLLHGPSIAHDYERLKPHFGKSGKNFHLFVVNFM